VCSTAEILKEIACLALTVTTTGSAAVVREQQEQALQQCHKQ
jgi:hypothetical protein